MGRKGRASKGRGFKKSAFKNIPGTQPCCGECGCSLDFKTRALSTECPLGEWKALVVSLIFVIL